MPQVLSGQGNILVKDLLLELFHWPRGVTADTRSIVGVLEAHDDRKRDRLLLTDSRACRWNGDTGDDWLRAVR